MRRSALRLPSWVRGEKKIKAHLARRRENEDAWLFEIRIETRSEAPSSPRPALAGRGRREAPGERLSEESSCIGVLGTRFACFCVEADQQFVGESDPDGHFVFSRGQQPVTEGCKGLVVFGGGSGDQEQDR